MFYGMFFAFLQHRFDKKAVKYRKICLFQKIAVILYPIKFALMRRWHKFCITDIKNINKITFLIKQ